MQHTHVVAQAPLGAEPLEAVLGLVPIADHAGVVGHGHHQRAGVEVALLGAGVDLQGRPARARVVNAHAVVHDPLEHRQRPYPHRVEEHATALAEAMETALPRWIVRVAPEVEAGAVVAAVMDEVRRLLASDIDDQTTTPLAIVRDVAVPMLTAALRAAGVPPRAQRDDFSRQHFPDDVYGLSPSSWADIDESLTSPGIAWGAAKAWTHKQRRSA